MPAIVLTIVDVPDPLSPTRPTTSPAWTAKSTRSRAWTGPNRLLTPSSWRSALELISARDSGFFAGGRVRAGTEFGGADEAVRDHRALDVFFGDGDRFQQDRGHLRLPVVDFIGDFAFRHFFPFGERDGDFRADLRLRFDFLVDRHVLLSGEDPLQPGDRGVLPGHGLFGRVDPGPFHRRDRAASGVVVGRVDAGEAVVAEGGDRLLRLAPGVFGGPARGVVFLGDVDAGGFEAIVGTFLEQRHVRVGRVAVDHDDRAAGAAVFFQFLGQGFGLEFSHFEVVEGDVGVDFAVFDQTVVAEDRHVWCLGLFADRRRRFGVHRVDDEDFGALRQRRFGLALLFFRVAAGVVVEDFAVFADFFYGFFEVRPVIGLIARRFVFGQQQGDLGATATAAAAATRCDGDECQQHTKRDRESLQS